MDGGRKRELSTDTDNTDISFSSPSPPAKNSDKKKNKKKPKMDEVITEGESCKDTNLEMILKSLNEMNRKHDEVVRKLDSVADSVATKEDVKSIRDEMENINKSLSKRIEVLESHVFTLQKDNDGLTNRLAAMARERGELEEKLSSYEQKVVNCEKNANDHEQHARGWNLRFFGFPEVTGGKETVGDCVDKVVKLVNEELKVEIDKDCIEIAHRTGQNRQRASRDGEEGGAGAGAGTWTGAGAGATGAKNRPIIVRFFSRILRDEIISKRKVLKGKGISIGDDLTPLNFKLLKRVQEHHATLSAWSHRGKILAKLKNGAVLQVHAHSNIDEVLLKGMRGIF